MARTRNVAAERPLPCLLLGLVLLHMGCAGQAPAFSSRYPDNRAADAETMLARIEAAPPRDPLPIAVGVTDTPRQLYAFEIPTRKVLWKQDADPSLTPMLTEDAVVTQEGSDIVCRGLRDGKRRFVIEAGDGRLAGASGDRKGTAVAISRGQGTFARSRLLLLVDGAIRWEHEVPGQAGAPSVVGNLVLQPWNHQFLSALDHQSGNEVARIRVTDGVIGHAFRDGDGVFVGGPRGLTRVDGAFITGRFQTDAALKAPERELPGRPLILRDVYDPRGTPAPDSARHSIRLEYRLSDAPRGKAAFVDDQLYLVFYRFIFALAADDLQLRWVHRRDQDIVGAVAQPGGLMVAGGGGNLALLASDTGDVRWEGDELPRSLSVVLPRVEDATSAAGAGTPDAEVVRAQLVAAAADDDARLVPMRLLAIELLGASDNPETTEDLLGLCQDRRVAPPVRKAACEALRTRTSGKQYVLTALEGRHDYLEQTDAPPVGALAQVVVGMGAREAVPSLVQHLRDPHTPSADLKHVVQALQDLGDAEVAPALASFMALYHADILDPQLAVALEAIPHALVVLQGQEAVPALQAVVDDELSGLGVRAKAREALHRLRESASVEAAEPVPAEQAEAPTPEAAPAEPDKPARHEPPSRITSQVLAQLLMPHRDALQKCFLGSDTALVQARLVVVVEDGALMMVSVLPKQLQGCIEPIVRGLHFPTTRFSRRDQINYTLKRK